MASSLIVSFQPGMEPLAERDIHGADPRARLAETLEPGVWRVEAASGAPALVGAIRKAWPIALRHMHPVEREARLEAPTPESLAAALVGLGEHIPSPATWSVQTRVLSGAPALKAYDVNDAVAAAIGRDCYERKSPEWVVSVCVAPGRAFAGVSRADDNLSPWPGGAARYAGGADALSRAKKKLMEAIDTFGLAPRAGQRAVDLGAAPGGWSQLLLELGLSVTAVDPALLDDRLAHPGLTHFRGTAERWLTSAAHPVDLMVSDMRMDARDAARLLIGAARWLTPGGDIVATLKLPERGFVATLDDALGILAEAFAVRARHLFHNRQEVTVHLVPRR